MYVGASVKDNRRLLKGELVFIKIVSMIRKYHNHKLQTTPRQLSLVLTALLHVDLISVAFLTACFFTGHYGVALFI